jgi:hypothetical protein
MYMYLLKINCIYLISKYFESNKNSGQEHYVTLFMDETVYTGTGMLYSWISPWNIAATRNGTKYYIPESDSCFSIFLILALKSGTMLTVFVSCNDAYRFNLL